MRRINAAAATAPTATAATSQSTIGLLTMQKLEYIPIPQAANTAGTVPVRTKPVPVRVKFPTSGDNFETVANISTAQDFMDFQKTLEHMINRDQ